MSKKGWVRIDRKIIDHWVWKDKPFSKGQAWIDIILMASHEEREFTQGNTIVKVLPGQLVTSEVFLAERWGWGRKKISNFLNLLETEMQIVQKRTKKGTTITLVNWGLYQTQGTTQGTSQEHHRNITGTSQEHLTTMEQCNNVTSKEEVVANNNMGEGNNNINNNIYITPPSWKTIQPVPEIPDEDLQGIVKLWNAIPHTVKLRGIQPMSPRYNKLRVAIASVGMDGVKEAIQSVKDSEWMKAQGHIVFDTFILDQEKLEKLLEGSYNAVYAQGGRNGYVDTIAHRVSDVDGWGKQIEEAKWNV